MPPRLSETEQALWEAYPVGARVTVAGRDDGVIRSDVIRRLLLGEITGEPGCLPALRLTGARITGVLELAYAEIGVPVSLHECVVEGPVDLYGSRLRQLSLVGCTVSALNLSNASIDVGLRMVRCDGSAEVKLSGARIGGALSLDGTTLRGTPVALNGTRLTVGDDLLAGNGFTSHGAVWLNNAEIGGSLRCPDATFVNPDGAALFAPDLRVGAVADLCDGFEAHGTVCLAHAQIISKVCFNGAVLAGTAGPALDCRHLATKELVLLPARPIAGAVDLSHAQIGSLRDDPATWPNAVRLDGLTYESLPGAQPVTERLRWLRLDPDGFRPRAYGQLAALLRDEGRDDDARTVMLAGERHRRATLSLPGRVWGYLQDLTVGYGYLPLRAAGWLAALLLVGSITFGLHPPAAADPGKAPDFVAALYTLDLLLPVDLGQQSAFPPRGGWTWLAFLLVAAGLLFITTIAAATARRLRRQ